MTDKMEKFINLAEKRLEKAVHAIEILIPLSDKTRYEYSEKQANYIIKTLKNAVSDTEKSFRGDNVRKKKISIPRD